MGKIARPQWTNRADIWVNQGEKFAPIVTLPDGKFISAVQKRNDVTAASIIGRSGTIAVMNYSVESKYQHAFHHAVNLRPFATSDDRNQWTREQMRNMAAAIPTDYPIEGNDYGEGTFSIHPGSQQALWYYQKRYEMRQEQGKPLRDYGHHANNTSFQGFNEKWYDNGGGSPSPTDPFFRNRYQSVANARAGIAYFNMSIDGLKYEQLVGCNVKHYAETASYATAYFGKRFAIEVMAKGMGKNENGVGPGFLVYNDWPKLEGVGDTSTQQGLNTHSVGNGISYFRRIESLNGNVITGVQPQVDYDWQTGMHLILGLMKTNGGTAFDIPTRFGTNPLKMAPLNTPGPGNDNAQRVEWDGPGAAPAEPEGYPVEPNRWMDSLYEAGHYYAQMGRTEGELWKPMSYRFEGSETWITPPADGAYILEAAAAFDGVNANSGRRGRPTVDGRFKGSALDFVAFDASRSRIYNEKIFVKGPNGQQYPVQLRGCVASAHNETINS